MRMRVALACLPAPPSSASCCSAVQEFMLGRVNDSLPEEKRDALVGG